MHVAHRRRPPLAAAKPFERRLQKAQQLIGTALKIPAGPSHAAKTDSTAQKMQPLT